MVEKCARNCESNRLLCVVSTAQQQPLLRNATASSRAPLQGHEDISSMIQNDDAVEFRGDTSDSDSDSDSDNDSRVTRFGHDDNGKRVQTMLSKERDRFRSGDDF